jgi:hypothetical protein
MKKLFGFALAFIVVACSIFMGFAITIYLPFLLSVGGMRIPFFEGSPFWTVLVVLFALSGPFAGLIIGILWARAILKD